MSKGKRESKQAYPLFEDGAVFQPAAMADIVSNSKNTYFDAESYENNPEIEKAWARSAVDHMEIHFNLITAVDPKSLKLTPNDDDIYIAFKNDFPDFKLDVLEEHSLKSSENKEKWHKFCLQFKDKVQDATYGTLVRIDGSGEYNESNTIFVLRIQFLAIEIARNREGLNNEVYENHRRKKSRDTV